jgi:hypothetical protein
VIVSDAGLRPDPGEYEVIRTGGTGIGAGRTIGYTGYKERLATAVQRREFPASDVVMVVAFGERLQMLRSPRRTAGGSGSSARGLLAGATGSQAAERRRNARGADALLARYAQKEITRHL